MVVQNITEILIGDKAFLKCAEESINFIERDYLLPLEDGVIKSIKIYGRRLLDKSSDEAFYYGVVVQLLFYIKKHFLFDLNINKDVNIEYIVANTWRCL